MAIVDNIISYSKSKGIKTGYLCEQLGVSRSFFSDVRQNKCSISEDRLTKIANILGTTSDFLTKMDYSDNSLLLNNAVNSGNIVNINRIYDLSKMKGIKLSFLCDKLGVNHGFFTNVRAGKCTIPDDRLAIIADILGTTTAYLRDETDDPSPIKKAPLSPEGDDERSQLKAELFALIDEMDDETLERFAFVERIISASTEDYEKIKAMIEIMLR